MSDKPKTWTAIVENSPDTDDLIIPLSEEMLEELGWEEGDELDWSQDSSGNLTLKLNKGTEWVLVDALSQYRMRYLVEVPKGKTDYALDTVSWEEAKEFDQLWLGENILSHRTITEQEALALFRSENDYFASWDDDIIKKNHFTFWVEDDG